MMRTLTAVFRKEVLDNVRGRGHDEAKLRTPLSSVIR